MLLSFIFCIVLLAADQMTKYLAFRYVRPAGSIPLIPGVFELQYVQNRGAAFGLLQNRQFLFCIFALLITAAIIYIYLHLPKSDRYRPLRILCCFLCAGALGNMIDRIAHGYVIDFLYFSLIDFPVFNAADIYVTVSCVVLLILILFYYSDGELKDMLT